MGPVHIAFVWHMHQPWYLWPGSQRAALPFTRLHACSAYYDMPWLLVGDGTRLDDTRVTFNLVPSLVSQLEGYVAEEITDRALELSLRDPADLNLDDRRYLLTHMCGGQATGAMAASPRYGELSHKRGPDRKPEAIDRACRIFEGADYRDLQVLFNLAWCGFALAAESEVVAELRRKDRGFTEDEKLALIDEMRAAAGRVLDLYRGASERGRAELICSPFYHPIMPLLADMRDARRRIPAARLPDVLWREPGEARRQLRDGLAHHEQVFGARPRGVWPSEGAVSDAALDIVAGEGVQWAASDEEVLAASLASDPVGDARPTPEQLYRPWLAADGRLTMIFRDHRLSDLIGFVYRDWAADDAAADFVARLRAIGERWAGRDRPPLVSVILDGENPWGWYADAGEAFLTTLYRLIEADEHLQTTTVAEHLDQFPAQDRLESVFPGSWIDHSFSTWIGGAEHRRAWELLTGALEGLRRHQPDAPGYEDARRHLMIAEGSDWFWWYSESQHTPDADIFDALFRAQVAQVYASLGEDVPPEVEEPIYAGRISRLTREAAGSMQAAIDGRISGYFEWQAAALLRTSGLASAMQRSGWVVHELYFGFDTENLWLRIDTDGRAAQTLSGCRLEVIFVDETRHIIALAIDPETDVLTIDGDLCEHAQCAIDRIIEARVPLQAVDAGPGSTLRLAVVVGRDGRVIERWPEMGSLAVRVPTEEAMAANWFV